MKISTGSCTFDTILRRHKGNSELCQMLVHNLKATRSKIDQVSSRIPYYNGQLTVHDMNHVDALWEMVDLLLYDNEEQLAELNLNPLELYILGTAILVHDVGLSAVALSDGLDQLRTFSDFEPTLRGLLRRKLEREPSARDLADYDLAREGISDGIVGALLRSNHATIAAELMTTGWTFANGERNSLIESDELRADWAKTIGAIARSHNDDVKDLRRLPEIESIRAGRGVNWTVRPQFLAGILRCADALQIDHRRAPELIVENTDFEAESGLHWRAQSKIRNITADQHLIRVYSTAFESDESEIWWQGFEMFRAAQRELDAVDTFLRQSDYPRFHRRRILGIEAPESFAKYLRFCDTFPFRPEIKIGAPRQIIARLGGSQLYGSERNPPLRELLMNGRDAIVARRNDDRKFTEGKIRVRFERLDGDVVMSIADDGVGMDRYTLSEILLDFGNSYWRRDERWTAPSIGMYGIGFFSVFMWADLVRVISRPPGQTAAHALVFRNGLHSRPEFKEVGADAIDGPYSTVLYLRLRSEELLRELVDHPLGGVELVQGAKLMDVVYGLLPITDIHIEIDCFGDRRDVAPTQLDAISGYALQHRLRFDSCISRTVGESSSQPFVVFSQTIVDETGRAIGLGWPANVGDGTGTLRSVVTVAGFPTASYIADFAGAIEGLSTSASRARYEPIATEAQMSDWFRRCQKIMSEKHFPIDYIWARWAFRLGADPIHATFLNLFDTDCEKAKVVSLRDGLERGVRYLQIERSNRFYRFFRFYRDARFAYCERLTDLATLDDLLRWLEVVLGHEWRFAIRELRVPVEEAGGKFIFTRKRDKHERGLEVQASERVIEISPRVATGAPEEMVSREA